MKRLILPVLFAAAAAAQSPESLSQWLWVRDGTLVQTSGLAEIRIDQTTLAGARDDLADLRLYDAQDREIPYALRILRDEYSSDEFEAAEFNRSAAGRTSYVSLALGENPPPHNEVAIETAGENFRRRARVEGSDDGSDWATLVDDYLLRFSSGGRSVEVDRLRYPESRYRYLRVSVEADPAGETGAPAIEAIGVRQTVREEGEEQEIFVPTAVREPTNDQGRPASAYRIDLGGRIPLQGLRFSTSEPEFARPYRLEAVDGEYPRLIASGTLRSEAGATQTTLRFEETFASELLLTVTDDRNPPLGVYSVIVLSAVRQVVFEASSVASPIRLYYGWPSAGEPHYDFDDRAPRRPQAEQTVFLQEQRENPAYRAPEQPFTERAPWAVYLVLIAACLGLFAVLRNLVREAGAESQPQA